MHLHLLQIRFEAGLLKHLGLSGVLVAVGRSGMRLIWQGIPLLHNSTRILETHQYRFAFTFLYMLRHSPIPVSLGAMAPTAFRRSYHVLTQLVSHSYHILHPLSWRPQLERSLRPIQGPLPRQMGQPPLATLGATPTARQHLAPT